MKEKKNIDNIFNEGFKNLEATPSPRVWKKIQTELANEKKNRKVIPLWIKLGGVAALVALLVTVGNTYYNPLNNDSPSITDENIINLEKKLQNNDFEVLKTTTESTVASEEKTRHIPTDENNEDSDASLTKSKVKPKASNKIRKNTSEKTSNAIIASSDSKKRESKHKENPQQDLFEKNISKDKLKENIAFAKNSSENTTTVKSGKETNETIINKDKNPFEANKEHILAVENSKKNTLVKTEAEQAEDSKNTKSIFDAIAETNQDVLIEKKKKEKLENRWNVAPSVAPVYYSSLENGSSIDPSFSDNPQKGEVNMSYGVQVSYALSKRLSVRTGVNNLDLSYSTSGIEVGTGPVSVALRSVDYGGSSVVLTAVDRGSFAAASPSGEYGAIRPKSTQGNASLIQNINYYEVPVELKYAVIDSKFGVNIIGGLSTLFLGNNEISVKADNFNTVLGDANNLSTVSFSTNIGLGLDYKLSKKFTFNIEPMFKYQLNPYTDSSVNFKPYYMGVYSGLSFRF